MNEILAKICIVLGWPMSYADSPHVMELLQTALNVGRVTNGPVRELV